MKIDVKKEEARIEEFKRKLTLCPVDSLFRKLKKREDALTYHKNHLNEILEKNGFPKPLHYWNIKRNECLIKLILAEILVRKARQLTLFPEEKQVA